jgi:hypothetical protein
MKHLITFFDCGSYYNVPGRDLGNFTVSDFTHISSKILPFFAKYPIEGVKLKDFSDFSEVVNLIERKNHLTVEGLKRIHELKAIMNRSRDS